MAYLLTNSQDSTMYDLYIQGDGSLKANYDSSYLFADMSNLDFSKKYRIKDTNNEINELGKSVNTMSDKLENTIKELKELQAEAEKADIMLLTFLSKYFLHHRSHWSPPLSYIPVLQLYFPKPLPPYRYGQYLLGMPLPLTRDIPFSPV